MVNAVFTPFGPPRRCPPGAAVPSCGMPTPLTYTTLSLTRFHMARQPKDWVDARMSGGLAAIPVCGSKNLVKTDASGLAAPSAVVFEGGPARDLMAAGWITVLLGTDGDTPVFAVGLDEATAQQLDSALGPDTDFMDIRAVGPLLPAADAHLMAHGRGMVHWHSRTGFCGVCGSATEARHNGHERHCTNPDCGVSHFPRTDPAVIVLVDRDDVPGGQCLMGRHARWPFGMYSTLAGFVEPGETLEQTVYREIFEESGIETTDITYMASQPWPFPQSLMLGFRAKATSFDVCFDPDELQDCRWFSRDEVLGMKEWTEAEGEENRLPRKDSIARWLIQSWIDEG